MKKNITRTIVFLVVLLLCSFTLFGCTITLPGCDEVANAFNLPKSGSTDTKKNDITAEWSFTIKEVDGWYYPTARGTLITNIDIDSIVLCSLDQERPLTITRRNTDASIKTFEFNTAVIYGSIEEGYHEAYLKVKKGSTTYVVENKALLYADDLYTAIGGVVDFDWEDETFEPTYINAMDKESNWIGPY